MGGVIETPQATIFFSSKYIFIIAHKSVMIRQDNTAFIIALVRCYSYADAATLVAVARHS